MANEKDNDFVLWKHLQYFGNQLWARIGNYFASKVHSHTIGDVSDLQDKLTSHEQQIEALSNATAEAGKREVIEVATYDDLENIEEPSSEVIYITADEQHLYLYSEENGFQDVTNKPVDNTIYVNDLNALLEMTFDRAGIFTVVHSRRMIRGARSTVYTMSVTRSAVNTRPVRITYTPTLSDKDGWAGKVYNTESGEYEWEWHKYAYNDKLLTSGTRAVLLALCNSNELIPGTWYRMTDFVTTAVSEEDRVRSAGHPFDLLLFATSTNSFSKHVQFLLRPGDTYFKDCDLASWAGEYDFENNTEKYAWADEEDGKGVIFGLIDEHGNSCPYDFKNIQFKRWAIEDISSSTLPEDALSNLRSTYCYDQNGGKHFATKDVYGNWIPQDSNGVSYAIDEDNFGWYYTFHGLRSEDGETVSEGYDISSHQFKLTDECIQYLEEDGSGADLQDYCKENIIKPAYYEYFVDDEYYKGRRVLNDIVFINGLSYCYYNEEDEYWEYQSGYCYGNVFGVECKNSTFGNYCYWSTFGNDCYSNTFGNGCQVNTFGNDCSSNTFGNNCYSNTFGNYFQSNTFGNYCYRNTFGNYFQSNTFGNNCYYNTFGNNCYNNTFGNNCNRNTFGNYCNYNTFGNDCYNNTFGNNCYYNTFGNDCYYNTFGNGCQVNTFGNYIRQLTVFDGVQYVSVAGGSSSSSYVQNAQILNGTCGVNANNKLQISFVAGANYTQIAAKKSNGNLVVYNPADLA